MLKIFVMEKKLKMDRYALICKWSFLEEAVTDADLISRKLDTEQE
jgi:hypothetical protein